MFGVDGLSDYAFVVLGQLFVHGPTWDGNLAAKSGRDELVKAGLASKVGDGWNYLTEEGVRLASEWRFPEKQPSFLEQCWNRKVNKR